MVKTSSSIHQLDKVVRKASDVSAADHDGLYQTHVKNNRIFSGVATALLIVGNICTTSQFVR